MFYSIMIKNKKLNSIFHQINSELRTTIKYLKNEITHNIIYKSTQGTCKGWVDGTGHGWGETVIKK